MAINEAAGQGCDIPVTDDGRNFCLSFHLKGVCNMHCGVHHSYIPLYQSEFERLSEWHNRFCVGHEMPTVQEVDTGSLSQASTLSDRTNRNRGSRRCWITTGGGPQ